MGVFMQYLKMRRSRLFWTTTVFVALVSILIFGKFAFGYVPGFLSELLPRIPYINSNNEIIVEVFGEQLAQKEKFIEGTPVYQFQPELALVGYVGKVDKSHEQLWRFYLQILKKYEVLVLRDDSRFEFLHTSPSLLTILGRFFNREQNKDFKQQMLNVAKKNRAKLAGIFSRLSNILGQKINNQRLAIKILQDENLRTQISETVRREIIAKVDWDAIAHSIENNEHTGHIVEVLADNIHWKGVMTGVAEGSTQGIVDEVASHFFDPKYLSDNKTGKAIKFFGGLFSLALNPEEALKRAARGARKGAWQGGWRVTRTEIKRVLNKHNAQIVEHGSEVLKKAAQEANLAENLLNGFQALASNKNLFAYIKNKYGEEVAIAVKTTFSEAAHDQKIVFVVDEIAEEIQSVTSQWLEKFLLNHKKTGPNPMLLMAVREGISQKPEPQILCFPGKGLRVDKHYVYQLGKSEEK